MENGVQRPNPPTNMIGEPISQHIVSLQWSDNSSNEDGFRIYRDGSIISTVQANSTNFRDVDLEAGKQYRYSVRAFNEAGESEALSCTVKTLNPPLNVTINHIGVLFDHDPTDIQGPGDIRLVLLISDGKQTVQQIIPTSEGTFSLNDYEPGIAILTCYLCQIDSGFQGFNLAKEKLSFSLGISPAHIIPVNPYYFNRNIPPIC